MVANRRKIEINSNYESVNIWTKTVQHICCVSFCVMTCPCECVFFTWLYLAWVWNWEFMYLSKHEHCHGLIDKSQFWCSSLCYQCPGHRLHLWQRGERQTSSCCSLPRECWQTGENSYLALDGIGTNKCTSLSLPLTVYSSIEEVKWWALYFARIYLRLFLCLSLSVFVYVFALCVSLHPFLFSPLSPSLSPLLSLCLSLSVFLFLCFSVSVCLSLSPSLPPSLSLSLSVSLSRSLSEFWLIVNVSPSAPGVC